MEPIEEFIKDNASSFDELEVKEQDWDLIKNKMNPPKKKSNFLLWFLFFSIIIAAFCMYYFNNNQNEIKKPIAKVGLEQEMFFPDIVLNNPDGEHVAISDLKGKVVLVEFWASYCMVCTHNHCYYFKPLHQEYKKEGFEIYSISADSSAVNWVHAIERDELDWIHVSDLMGLDSPIMTNFDVESLPSNYLLDQNGKIIAKNIEVDELEDTLDMLLASNNQ